MTEERAPVGNIGPGERRKRRAIGVAMLVVGLVIAAGLILGNASWPWRTIVFVPFWLGALGIFQARENT